MNNQFSENLKKVRKEHNLSQEQLADELGVSRQAISKWESGTSYPEMDKIIALCNKFNLNIDDLLHKDIKEIKGEEESKKKLNKSIEDFLKFITDTINLFSNMNFKSKIKCLFEQAVILGLLIIISSIIINLSENIFYDLLFFLPSKIKYFINSCLTSLLILFCIISSLIILTHVFKTRYLDYYNKLKKEIKDENTDNTPKLNNNQELNENQNKILFRKNENKIIIRDPKHSEYRFINSLFKLIVGIIKFFALCLAFFISLFLIVLFLGLVLSFLVSKTGLFFLGLLTTLLSTATITIIILLIILNFVFNRTNNKKQIIWSFIISLILFGCGLGLIFIGSLNFEIIKNNDLKIETIEYEMKEDTFFNFYNNNVKYVEANISNIKVEYKINKYYKLDSNAKNNNYGIHVWTYCSDPLKLTKEFIKNINNKKIVPQTNEINSIVVYASKENIEKLKTNKANYFKLKDEENSTINYYKKRINELENELENYEIKSSTDEDKISELNATIKEYETILKSSENE